MREWITGRNPVYEVLKARRRDPFRLWIAEGVERKGRINEIIELAAARKVQAEQVPRRQLDGLASGGLRGFNHQGVALEASGYSYSALEDMLEVAEKRGEPPFLLILDALQDPQNLGALLRTAEAVGVQGVLLPLRQTVTVTPAVVAASSGASELLKIAQANLAQAIQTLKENNVWIIGLDSGPDAQPPDRVRLDGSLALVVGSEGEGMRRLVRESCDVLLRLPMRGQIESFNAAVAGSIALYLASQARGFPS